LLEPLPPDEAKTILQAVALHGVKDLPDNLDERTLLFCRLIRDADKLDIYRVVLDYYARYAADPAGFELEVEFPEEPWYSQEVFDAVMRGQNVDYGILKTWNDAKIMQMGWVHDMNFPAALARVRDQGYLDALAAFLPENEQIRRLRLKIADYVDRRIAAER